MFLLGVCDCPATWFQQLGSHCPGAEKIIVVTILPMSTVCKLDARLPGGNGDLLLLLLLLSRFSRVRLCGTP